MNTKYSIGNNSHESFVRDLYCPVHGNLAPEAFARMLQTSARRVTVALTSLADCPAQSNADRANADRAKTDHTSGMRHMPNKICCCKNLLEKG